MLHGKTGKAAVSDHKQKMNEENNVGILSTEYICVVL